MDEMTFDPSSMKILMVDDVAENIRVLSQVLRPQGYQLAVAQCGEKALKVAGHFKPDLILLDVMMPGIDGFETCRQLKACAFMAYVPVVFLTAKSDINDIVDAFDVGAVDYITKPFNHQEVCVRIRTHLQLRYSRVRLKQLNEEKNKLLGMAAHDLRNPISTIQGYSEMLLDEECDQAETQDVLRCMQQLAQDMFVLVNDLVDASSVEQGELRLLKADTCVADLVNNKVKMSLFRAKKKNIQLDRDIAEDIPEIALDATRIGQVLDNLIGNAIKYSDAGSRVVVVVEAVPGHVRFAVTDNGHGINPADVGHLFSAFRCADNRPTAGETSTGLGLAIAKKMVQAHGGEIGVESQVGEGSTFYFTLPLSDAEKSPL